MGSLSPRHHRDDEQISPAPKKTPRPRARTVISLSGLLDAKSNKESLERPIDSSDGEDGVDVRRRKKPRPVNAAAEELFASFEASPKRDHLIFRDFDGTLRRRTCVAIAYVFSGIASRYEKSMQARARDTLQRIDAELEGRIRGLDKHGNPIDRLGVPTAADLEQLEEFARIINKEVSDETLMIQLPQDDGSRVIRQMSLREIVATFQKLDAKREKQLLCLENELVVLNAEIAAAYDSLYDESKHTRIHGIKECFEREQAELNKAIKRAQAELEADLAKLNAEEKAMNAEKYRKVVELLRPVRERSIKS